MSCGIQVQNSEALGGSPAAAVIPTLTDRLYNAGDFTGNGAMTWTVEAADLTLFKYGLWGTIKLLYVGLSVNASTVGGAANNALQVLIPGGFLGLQQNRLPFLHVDNGAPMAEGFAEVNIGSNLISLFKMNLANWTPSANLTYLWLSHVFVVA